MKMENKHFNQLKNHQLLKPDSVKMSGPIPLLRLYACVVWTEKTVPLPYLVTKSAAT